jgi:hypothetical protein
MSIDLRTAFAAKILLAESQCNDDNNNLIKFLFIYMLT